MSFAVMSALLLAARLGRGATGHHSVLYIAGTVVIVIVAIGAAMLRRRR